MLDFPSNGILGGEYFPGYVVDIGADEVLPMYEGICNKPLSIGGGNSNIFWNFHPENWGMESNLTRHIFQTGWFNHQLGYPLEAQNSPVYRRFFLFRNWAHIWEVFLGGFVFEIFWIQRFELLKKTLEVKDSTIKIYRKVPNYGMT